MPPKYCRKNKVNFSKTSKNKEADEVEDESSETEECVEIKNKKAATLKKVKSQIVKNKAPLAVEESSDNEEDEDAIVTKKKPKPKVNKAEIDTIAIKYFIPDQNHPFFHLHNKIGSVPVEKIIDYDSNVQVALIFMQNKTINFIKFFFEVEKK